MKLVFSKPHLSIASFPPIELPKFTLLTGVNCVGKTHLLKAIENGAVSTPETVMANRLAPFLRMGALPSKPAIVQNTGVKFFDWNTLVPSKAGVEMFSRVLAGELGPNNITVNAYAPGMIPTEMNHFAERDQTTQERLLDTLTLRRWGEPADVANLICFLASDVANHITGTEVYVDGAQSLLQG